MKKFKAGEGKDQMLQEMKEIFDQKKVPGEEITKGIKWLSSCELDALKRYRDLLVMDPDLIQLGGE